MPKKQDSNQSAISAIERLIGEPLVERKTIERPKNPAAVALGRLGGKKGGPARAASLTKEQRKAIAKKAAKARWGKRNSTGSAKRLTGKELSEKLKIDVPSIKDLKEELFTKKSVSR